MEVSRFWVLMIVIKLLIPFHAWSGEAFPDADMQVTFDKAINHLNAFQNDDANLLLTELICKLKEEDKLNTSFGLKVQLRQAEALEKDHQNVEAISRLLEVITDGKRTGYWDIVAHGELSLARLHEKLEQEINCQIHLKRAYSSIIHQQLDSIYPRYCIRNASYHRLFNNIDTALYYANEVLRTAPGFGLYQEEAVGHLLVGIILEKKHPDKAARHYGIAGEIFLRFRDYTGYSYTTHNLSRIYYRDENYLLALSYNDSTLVTAQKSINSGHDYSMYNQLKFRGTIYKALGEIDSAWYYLNLGVEAQLAEIKDKNSEQVVEIEARYNVTEKAQRIEEQEQMLQFERERKNWLKGIVFIILAFTGTLIYYYYRLRVANRKTREQALTINETNKELSVSLKQQITLQGEIHHRVKNNLQIIISLLELQVEDIDDPKALDNLKAMSNCIYSMAAIHELLYQKEGTKLVNMLEYAESLCAHYTSFLERQEKPLFKLDFGKQYFNLETLMPLGIILNELLTNSLKHAAILGKQIEIGISVKPCSDGFCMSYRDNGPGFPDSVLQEREGGLGSYLLKSMTRQLDGHLESANADGAVCKVFFKEKNKTQYQENNVPTYSYSGR